MNVSLVFARNPDDWWTDVDGGDDWENAKHETVSRCPKANAIQICLDARQSLIMDVIEGAYTYLCQRSNKYVDR